MLRVPWGLWFVMLLLSWVRPASADWPPASPTTWGASCVGGASCSGGGTFASKAAAISSLTSTCSGYSGGTGTPAIDSSDLATVNAVPFVGGSLNCNNSINLANWSIFFNGTCPGGATVNTTSGLCENTACVTGAATRTVYNYTSRVNGSTTAPCPSVVCSPAGCESVVLSCSAFGIALTGGASPSTTHTGAAQITAQPCGSAVVTIAIGGTSTNTSGAAAGGAVGGGIGGTGTGFNASDALNLQAIARNTSGLAGTGVAAAVTAAGAGIEAKLDSVFTSSSGDLATAKAETATGVGSLTDAMKAGVDAQISQIDLASVPTFSPGTRWQFLLDPFIGADRNCSHTWTMTLPGLSTVSGMTIDICPWAAYFQGFMFWALGIWTCYALWSIVFHQAARKQD